MPTMVCDNSSTSQRKRRHDRQCLEINGAGGTAGGIGLAGADEDVLSPEEGAFSADEDPPPRRKLLFSGEDSFPAGQAYSRVNRAIPIGSTAAEEAFPT